MTTEDTTPEMLIANATIESASKYAVKSGLPMHQIVAIQMMISASRNYSEATLLAIADAAFKVTIGALVARGVLDDDDLDELKLQFEKLMEETTSP